MGMDVYSKHGDAYFRNNVWWWRPLADYCIEVASYVTRECKHWHSNAGDGLDEDGCRLLAGILEEKLAAGEVAAYAKKYENYRETAADVTCWLCKGSGMRHDEVIDGECNVCAGTGKTRPSVASYPFSEENVKEFAEFLRLCQDLGGFEIW